MRPTLRSNRRLAYLLAAVMAVGVVGCTSFQQTEYKVVGAVADSVDTAMKVYGDLYRQGNPTAIRLTPPLQYLYQNYQNALKTVADANIAYDEAVKAGLDTTSALANVKAATAALQGLASDIVGLVQTMKAGGS